MINHSGQAGDRMPILQLTNDELQHLALVAHARNSALVSPQFRARILEAALRGGDPQGLALTVPELWLLDDLLILPDPRSTKTPNGKPVLDLLKKVWRVLVEVHYARQDSTGSPKLRARRPCGHHARSRLLRARQP